MVATASTQRFFRKAAAEGGENTNEWHAYRDDGRTALCGEAQLTYNVDSVADALPHGGTLHLGCREALSPGQQPQAEAGDSADSGTETEVITGVGVADLNATLSGGAAKPSKARTARPRRSSRNS